ncbi:hypothetical protein AB0P45_29590, partial [Streptomyces niveus]
MERKHTRAFVSHAQRHGRAASDAARAEQADLVRTRVRLMIEITARAGAYRKGLVQAAERLSPEEAEILADLEG